MKLAACLLLILTGCAHEIMAPPARYQVKLGTASISIEPTKTVKCLKAGVGLIDGYACTSTATKKTRIGNPCLWDGLYAQAVCHDVVGHQINGWPGDHPK